MVHALSFLALVVCSTAVQGYFIQSNADANTVDVGHFKSMNEFYAHLGTTEGDWQDIQVDAPIKREESDGPDSDLAGDGFYNTTGSGTLVPPAVCSTRSPWRDIVCEDMPIHKWQYAHHRPLPIKYTRTRMENLLLDLASSLRAGKDRKMKYRQKGNQRLRPDHDITYDNLKFTVPMSSVHAIEFNKTITGLMVHMHYIFDREEGHIWYKGATVSLGGHDMLKMEASGTPDYSNITGDVSGTYDYPVHPAATWNYNMVVQVWRQTDYPPTASPECIAQVIKWHIDHAAARHSRVCTQLEQLGGWWAWLKININEGRFPLSSFGCCDGRPLHREKLPLAESNGMKKNETEKYETEKYETEKYEG